MKKLTKVLAVILAAVFVFGCFAACSNSGKTDDTDSDLAYTAYMLSRHILFVL